MTAQRPNAATFTATPMRTPRWQALWIGLVGLSLAGWWISQDLLAISRGGAATIPGLSAVCGGALAGTAIDCASVLSSPSSFVSLTGAEGDPLWRNISWAAIGAAYFASLALWFILMGAPTARNWRWHALVCGLIGLGVINSVRLIWIMGVELNRWCVGCLLAHFANALLFIVLLLALVKRSHRPAADGGTGSPRLPLATCWACASLAALQVVVVQASRITKAHDQLWESMAEIVQDPTYPSWDHARQPRVDISPRHSAAALAPLTAPITAVVFTDLQCPYCRGLDEVLQKVHAKYPEQVRIVYRHFPMDPECNPRFPKGDHVFACKLAHAAEACRVVGGPMAFLRFKDLVYDRLEQLPTASLGDWAAECGVDPEEFGKALRAESVAAAVAEDLKAGTDLGVDALPTVFVDNRRFRYWDRPEAWDAILGALLAPMPAAPPGVAASPRP